MNADPANDFIGDTDLSITRVFASAGVDVEMAELVHRLMNYRLTRIARNQKRRMRIGDSLPTVELVDDAVLRLLRADGGQWSDRFHILATAAKAIEQLAINHHKRKVAAKRGGGAFIASLSKSDPVDSRSQDESEFDSVQDAIARLVDRTALVVRLRAFGEMTFVDIADELGLNEKTVRTIYRSGLQSLHRDLQNDFR